MSGSRSVAHIGFLGQLYFVLVGHLNFKNSDSYIREEKDKSDS